jgi:pantothenate kinase-related protein Tda10
MDAKKQTAVDLLIEQFSKNGYIGLQDELQAKAMFKHQIEQAFREGWFDGNNPLIFNIENERYYNEKYKDESKTNI